MKKLLICIIMLLFVSQKAFPQSKLNKLSFCNNNKGELSSCKTTNYLLKFDKQLLKYIVASDSSIFYDVEKQCFRVNTQFGNTITIKLQENGVISVYDKKKDSSYEKEMIRDDVNCETQSEFVDMFNSDTTFITFSYGYCRLGNIFIGDTHIGSINLVAYKCTKGNKFSWDVSIVPFSTDEQNLGQSLKILTNKETGSPYLICISDEIKYGMYEKDAGVEIVSSFCQLSDRFYKVRKLDKTTLLNVFAYEDLLVYDKRGKLTLSKIQVDQCDHREFEAR